MPIYEYYCPDNNTIYQFFAKTLAQGERIPRCPDDPAFGMEKIVSAFAITGRHREDMSVSVDDPSQPPVGDQFGAPDPKEARMEAAMAEMEGELSGVDESDPRAMGRMLRRMAEVTGEKLDDRMEEVVRKLEEGADPDKLDEQFGAGMEPAGDDGDPYGGAVSPDGSGAGPGADPREPRVRLKARRSAPRRDPQLYDYD